MKTNCQLSGFIETEIMSEFKLLEEMAGTKGQRASVKSYEASCMVSNPRVVRVPGLLREFSAAVTAPGVPSSPFGSAVLSSTGAFRPGVTALGAYTAAKSMTCTGLIYEVGEKAYHSSLEREKIGGYDVVEVSDQ